MSWLPFLLRLLLLLDEAVEEPAGAVEAAPPPVVEPEVFFCFSFCFGQRALRATRFFATRLRIFLSGIFLYFRM